jgi:hypothetical protein
LANTYTQIKDGIECFQNQFGEHSDLEFILKELEVVKEDRKREFWLSRIRILSYNEACSWINLINHIVNEKKNPEPKITKDKKPSNRKSVGSTSTKNNSGNSKPKSK